MKRILISVGILTGALMAGAQQVSVTGTVSDSNGNAYSNGIIHVNLEDANNVDLSNTVVNVNGAQITLPAYNGLLSSTGAFSVSLFPNAQISYTSTTHWEFSFCSQVPQLSPSALTPPQTCFDNAITVSGAGSITGSLTPTALSVTVPSGISNTFAKAVNGTTVSALPSASSATNQAWYIYDGTSATDCATGGGSTKVLCGSNGTAWAAVSGGGGGGLNGTVTYTANQTASTSDNGKTVVMNCSSACAYTLPNPQPSTTWQVNLQSTGSTVATIALGSSMTYNGSGIVPTLVTNQIYTIAANTATSTDYRGGIAAGPVMGTPIACTNTSADQTAITAADAAGTNILIASGTCLIGSTVTLNGNYWLFTSSTFSVASGQTLTLTAQPQAANGQQIFSGSGTVILAGTAKVAYCEMFGTTGNSGSFTDQTPCNAAAAAFNGAGGTVVLTKANYYAGAAFSIPSLVNVNCSVAGNRACNWSLNSATATEWSLVGTGANCATGATFFNTISGFNLKRTVAPSGTAKGIDLTDTCLVTLTNGNVQDSISDVYFNGTANTILYNFQTSWTSISNGLTLFGYNMDSSNNVPNNSVDFGQGTLACSNCGVTGATTTSYYVHGNDINDFYCGDCYSAGATYCSQIVDSGSTGNFADSDIFFNHPVCDSVSTSGFLVSGVKTSGGGGVTIVAPRISSATDTTPQIDIESSAGVTVTNGQLQVTSGGLFGVKCFSSSNVSVTGVNMLTTSTSAFTTNDMYLYQCTDSNFSNNVLWNASGGSGATMIAVTNASNRNSFGHNSLGGTASVGISFDASTSNNTVSGVNGIDTTSITTNYSDSGTCNMFDGNTFCAPGGAAIALGSTPSLSPAPGSITSGSSVTITCATGSPYWCPGTSLPCTGTLTQSGSFTVSAPNTYQTSCGGTMIRTTLRAPATYIPTNATWSTGPTCHTTVSGSGATSWPCTMSGASTANDIIFMFVNAGTSTSTTFSVTDSASNTWADCGGGKLSWSAEQSQCFFTVNSSSSTLTVTLHSTASLAFTGGGVNEFTGNAASTPIDVQATTTGTKAASSIGLNNISCASVTPTQNNDLVIEALPNSSAITAGTAPNAFTNVAPSGTNVSPVAYFQQFTAGAIVPTAGNTGAVNFACFSVAVKHS